MSTYSRFKHPLGDLDAIFWRLFSTPEIKSLSFFLTWLAQDCFTKQFWKFILEFVVWTKWWRIANIFWILVVLDINSTHRIWYLILEVFFSHIFQLKKIMFRTYTLDFSNKRNLTSFIPRAFSVKGVSFKKPYVARGLATHPRSCWTTPRRN